MKQNDVIVLGGGIAGVSAAAEIATQARVTVIEAEPSIGYHATGRSAALFIRNYGNATLRALNAASAPFLDAPDGVSDRSLLSPRGELLVANESEMDALEAYANGASGLERLSPAEAVEIVPILRRESIVAALLERDAQDIDVDRMLQGYARLLRHRGGQIVTGLRVEALRHEAGLWRIETKEGEITAPVLINAAGAWADMVARAAGAAPLGITPMRRSAAILPMPEEVAFDDWPMFASAAERWYAKPEAGKLMVSPADEDPVDPHDAWPDDMVLAEGLHRYEQAVTVPVSRVERSWAGLRSFSPDRSPVVGFDPARTGLFWLAGQGGYGVQTAPALSRLAADLCLGRAPALSPHVVSALSPGRFATAGSV
ncbi:FAD-dependent oxidoreductase [Limimaricola sp. G21655-S1]|uniref:NAD(P)/FAD-dependent oxidoreductase n=1 Tax=Limimaricola sp. G21655-S1 TaxID=3014768 RepID=UPI0022AFD928|nr:FAD-dependent oxidoreductase [Limimaricola sp. G21655-S1]MCZ4262060.1 FAD-dependent oxidoreductase [Limimaricola sp. G21655-S1]